MSSGELGKELLRTVSLAMPQVQFLEMLADRGGEIPWDWSKVAPAAKAMLADLMNKRLVIDREYVTHVAQLHGALRMALTDEGKLAVESLRRARVNGTPAAPANTNGSAGA